MPKAPALQSRPLVIKRVPISQVVPWEDNPRGIRVEDFDRLKRQILELGVYKPLLVVQEKGRYVVLGGNMRLRALQDLGAQTVEVSIIEAKTKAQRIKYALSDNDRAGFYEDQKLAELVLPHVKDIGLPDFKVDIGKQTPLKDVIENFGPDIEGTENPEIEFTEELLEEHNYIVLYFDNKVDWLQALSLFNLKTVKALHAKPGFEAKGLGRVIRGAEAIKRLRDGMA